MTTIWSSDDDASRLDPGPPAEYHAPGSELMSHSGWRGLFSSAEGR